MDIEDTIQAYILYQYRLAASNKHYHKWLHKQGLNDEMIHNLRVLTPEGLNTLTRSKPFKVNFSKSILASQLRTIKDKNYTEELIIKALWLGASRQMLNDLEGITDTEYKNIKARANIEGKIRYKPRSIAEHLDNLAILHSNINQSNSRQSKPNNSLEILIKLSEVTGLEINRIYQDYWLRIGADAGGDYGKP